MSEFDSTLAFHITSMCRACLRTGDEVRTMSLEEINSYRTLLNEDHTTDPNMYVCVFCGHLLKKFTKFTEQCRRANNVFKSILQDSRFHMFITPLTSVHNMGPGDTRLQYLVDNSFNVDTNCLYAEDKSSVFDNDSFSPYLPDDDDEIPLLLLKDRSIEEVKVIAEVVEVPRKKKKGKRRSKDAAVHDETTEIKLELDMSIDPVDSQDSQRLRIKEGKQLRDGFSSRMVQETNEYIVIKLTKEQVLQEMKEKLTSDKYQRALYKCEKCVKGFNFEDVLKNHMEKHTTKHGSLQCDICTQYCPNAISLRGHIKSHTTRYQCKVCSYVRLSRQHLLEHYAINHTPDATRYACEHCEFTTNKRTVMQRHARTHSGASRHACDKCGKMFKNMESLRVHTARHDSSKCLRCEQCNRRFIYPSLLHRHVQAVHVHRDYYCVECDVRFKSPDNLRLHFKKAKKHRDPASYSASCPSCGARFPSAGALAVHCAGAHGAAKRHAC